MTTDVKLLPLPPLHIAPSVEPVDYPTVAQALVDYARANMEPLIEQLSDTANALAAQTEVANHCKAESEWLRAENERLAEALRHTKEKLEHVAAIRGGHGTFAGTYLIVTEALDQEGGNG